MPLKRDRLPWVPWHGQPRRYKVAGITYPCCRYTLQSSRFVNVYIDTHKYTKTHPKAKNKTSRQLVPLCVQDNLLMVCCALHNTPLSPSNRVDQSRMRLFPPWLQCHRHCSKPATPVHPYFPESMGWKTWELVWYGRKLLWVLVSGMVR